MTETLRQSPIGTALKQGIPLELTKSTYSYLRAGWDYPHAVALLYALYLYAEKTGRRSFTLTEWLNTHSNPEAVGMSPADICGIEAKTFREHLQGLAVNFPKYIRVSFIANLDNIILPAGQRIRHVVFGEGTVMDVDNNKGAHIIKFDAIDTPRTISFKVKIEKM